MQISDSKPKYKHDCDKCIFLGNVKHSLIRNIGVDRDSVDLYVHTNPVALTVLYRWGDHGPDYVSGLDFSISDPFLALAAVRALVKGYIVVPDIAL